MGSLIGLKFIPAMGDHWEFLLSLIGYQKLNAYHPGGSDMFCSTVFRKTDKLPFYLLKIDKTLLHLLRSKSCNLPRQSLGEHAHTFSESNDEYNLKSWGVPSLGVPIILQIRNRTFICFKLKFHFCSKYLVHFKCSLSSLLLNLNHSFRLWLDAQIQLC